MSGIGARVQLLQYGLARETKTFSFPPACCFFRTHRRTRLNRLLARLCLLRFHRFALPAPRHEAMISELPQSRLFGVRNKNNERRMVNQNCERLCWENDPWDPVPKPKEKKPIFPRLSRN